MSRDATTGVLFGAALGAIVWTAVLVWFLA